MTARRTQGLTAEGLAFGTIAAAGLISCAIWILRLPLPLPILVKPIVFAFIVYLFDQALRRKLRLRHSSGRRR